MPRFHMSRIGLSLWRARKGSVAVMFALSLVPLAMGVGLAVDYSFFVASRAQLNLAADSAALHAVRIASGTQSSTAAGIQAGTIAGQQWWASQLGDLTNASVSPSNVGVSVTYQPTPSTYTATVTYQGTVPTHFSALFGLPSWPINGTATAVISNAYVEVIMLLDNSPSMLLGSTNADIVALEQATMCSTQAATAAQTMVAYPWVYPAHNPAYGFVNNGSAVPPATQVGYCNTGYTGAANACFYPMSSPLVNPNTGACTNGGGGQGAFGANTPQAPCAFACHTSATNNDYYGLARSIGVTLRLDVVQQAAANVIQSLQAEEQTPNQFSVGIYEFNIALQQIYPPVGTGEASTDLATALTTTQNVKNNTPLTSDIPYTNFPGAATTLALQLTNGGSGGTPAIPQKNLFIVTDGVEDATTATGRVLGPMTSATNETICQQFKNKGFNVYVLYTPYLPTANVFYLSSVKSYTEPTSTSPDVAALKACATVPANFYQASDPTAINTAMQAMLKSALNSAGRISQ